MFDTLSISDSLPYTQEMKDLGLDTNNRSWQTKNLENAMELYYIQGGRLFCQRFSKTQWIEGDANAKSVMDRFGHLERECPYLEPIYHHGEVYFYDFINDVDNKWDVWVEFKAVFTNGTVDRYELVKFEKKDNEERKQHEKEWKAKLLAEENKWSNKYIFHTKPYRWIARQFYRVCYNLGEFFHNLSYKFL